MSTVADIDHELVLPARFIVRRNQSLSWRGNKLFILYVGLLSFAIAGFFALQGLWLILPFAGLEILVLSICLYSCSVKNRQQEVITIQEKKLIVEKGTYKPKEVWEFERAWSNLELHTSKYHGHPSKLWVRSRGKQIEIGECLTDKERQTLATSLAEKIPTTLIKS